MANIAMTPMKKSQFDVCGATITTNCGRFGNSPSILHPLSRIAKRASERENALPRLAIACPSGGTVNGAIGIAAFCVFGWRPARRSA